MDNLINEFKRLSEETRQIVSSFPAGKRESVLFGRWRLKDVLAHLNHWAKHDLDCMRNLKEGKEPYWAPDIDKFNKEGVEKRKHWSWEKVHKEFLELTNEIIGEYTNLPKEMWDKKFWQKRRFTPRRFLEIDIKHYRDEHLPELRKYGDL